MLVRQLHLALGAHHAIAFDATDFADVDGDVDAGNIGAGLGHYDGDACAGVRRAADDLQFAIIGGDGADVQLVRIGVLLGGQHLADGKGTQFLGRVFNAFDLEAQIGQGIEDLVQSGRGIEV